MEASLSGQREGSPGPRHTMEAGGPVCCAPDTWTLPRKELPDGRDPQGPKGGSPVSLSVSRSGFSPGGEPLN